MVAKSLTDFQPLGNARIRRAHSLGYARVRRAYFFKMFFHNVVVNTSASWCTFNEHICNVSLLLDAYPSVLFTKNYSNPDLKERLLISSWVF